MTTACIIRHAIVRRAGRALLFTSALAAFAAQAAAPLLYRQPAHQSPVRDGPDDLLLLPGYGLSADDTVVYQAVRDGLPAAHPAQVPTDSTAEAGVAQVVSHNAPYSLTVLLPETLRPDQTYALWVRNARNE